MRISSQGGALKVSDNTLLWVSHTSDVLLSEHEQVHHLVKNITIRLDEGMISELESEADEYDKTRSEHIRDILAIRNEHGVKQDEYEDRIEDLGREITRLQNEKRTLIRDREERTELVEYVEQQRNLDQYRAKRERMVDQAGMLTRWKWKFTGIPVDE